MFLEARTSKYTSPTTDPFSILVEAISWNFQNVSTHKRKLTKPEN